MLLCEKMHSLKEVNHKKMEGTITVYTLLDISTLTNITSYPPFIEASLSTIEFLHNQSKILEKEMSEVKGDNDFVFNIISSLNEHQIEINNISFITYQIIVRAPKQELLSYRNRILALTQDIATDALSDISRLIAKVQSSEEIFKEFVENIKSCEKLVTISESYHSIYEFEDLNFNIISEEEDGFIKDDLNTDKDYQNAETHPSSFPLELTNLAVSLFKIGYTQTSVDISLIKKAIYLYLDKALQSHYIASKELQNTSELIIYGIKHLNTQAIWAILLEFTYRVDSQMIFEIEHKQEFEKYIKNRLSRIQENFDWNEFNSTISGIKNTRNGKYGLLKYRDDLNALIFNTLNLNHSFYIEKDMIAVINDKENKGNTIINSIINIPSFAYDKKFFIDQLMQNASQYDFIKYYAIPFLLEDDFPFFQDYYWDYLFDNFDFPNEIPIFIIDILLNDGVYWYSSNLPYLKKIIEKTTLIVIYSKQNDSEFNLHSYATQLLCIISNTLKLLKESPQQNEFSDSLIKHTAQLLQQEEIISIHIEKGYLEMLEHNDLLAYILQYYYTQDTAFAIPLDFDHLKIKYPNTYKNLLTSIIELFSDNDGTIQQEDLKSLKPVLGNLYQDIFDYIDNYKVLYLQFEREVFEALL